MKDVILADRPLFEIDPKAYLYGTDVVALARAADRASEGHDVTAVFASSILEVRAVVNNVRHILVYVPHLDPTRPGRGITDVLPKALAEAGVRTVMLNHTEHPVTFTVLEEMMQHTAEVGLATAACASSLAGVRAVASLGPNLLVAEPTEPTGTGKPSRFDYVEAPNRTVREINPGVRVLQGAGISTPTDVEAAIRNGADAAGPSSAIATASDLSAMAEAMICTARRGWDMCPRS